MAVTREQVQTIMDEYATSKKDITVGVFGSHSALEVAHGAKQQGFETVVVCEEGREATYTQHYDTLFDHALVLDSFDDMVEQEHTETLRDLNTVFVPNRSFSCYVGYDNIENRFDVPLLGNRFMLRAEERDADRNQYYLLDQADIRRPRELDDPKEIDSLSIVKVQEKDRNVERAFFYAASHEEFREEAEKRINSGVIEEDDLETATIEEVALGGMFNANYFWSPLRDEIDLLGFDRRIQTDLDGVLRLPADEQLAADVTHQNIEVGHTGATMRESQLEKIFDAGRRFVETCRDEYDPGMIGLFALQGVLNKDLEFVVFDVSPRVPGSPCLETTSPYMKYKYGEEVGPGRRVAMELERALEEERLAEVVT